MKKVLSIFLALAMLISLIPAVFADDTATEPGIKIVYDFENKFVTDGSTTLYSTLTWEKNEGFWQYAANSYNTEEMMNTGGHLRVENNNVKVVSGPKDADVSGKSYYWIAFKINVPKEGHYSLAITANPVSGGKKSYIDAFIFKADDIKATELTDVDIETCLIDEKNHLETSVFGADTGKQTLIFDGDKEHLEADEYFFVFKPSSVNISGGQYTTNSYVFLNSLTLTEGDGKQSVPMISSLTSKIENDVTTVTATAAKMSDNTDATDVTYSYAVADDDKALASVDEETGVVTGLADGKATIIATATKGDYSSSKSIEVEVTAPVTEPEEPGEAVTDTDKSVSVMPENPNEGTVTGLDDVVDEVPMGTTINPIATPADGYKFAYWKDSSGTVLSTNPNETFVINTNTAILAVFDKITPESSDKTTVELYNANGMLFHKNENVALNTSFADVAAAAGTPSLVGYVFKHWSMYANEAKIEDAMPITALTRAVAIYEEPEAQYTVKVGGTDIVADKKYKYGEEVTVTAKNTDFSCWKLGDKIVSYSPNYTFSVWGNVDLTEATDAVTEAPVATLVKDGENHLLIYSVPENYTKIEAGIIFSNNNSITVDTFDGKKTSEVRGTGQFMVSSDFTYARGYLIFKNASGEIRILYAD